MTNRGPWITSHPGIAKVAFTGSTATGQSVMRSSLQSMKRVTLELGGNDAAIVLPDVDVKKVAPYVTFSSSHPHLLPSHRSSPSRTPC